MSQQRSRGVTTQHRGSLVLEGAGVRLRRMIGSPELDMLDPFLLLDLFRSSDPSDFLPGFPWHPHRGIETVTYLLRGRVRHGDSLGNQGLIGPGDAQWMTAGHGIIHEEMPEAPEGELWGLQLWVNLSSAEKLCDPRYQEIPTVGIPEVRPLEGGTIRVIAGTHQGRQGPVKEITVNPLLLDVDLPPGATSTLPVPADHQAFALVLDGGGRLGGEPTESPLLVVLGEGEDLAARAGERGLRFLLAAARPLGEPVVRSGPFVMNTRAEIEQAHQDFRNGTFLKRLTPTGDFRALTSKS